MAVTRWSEKFYESTRGRIVSLLRRSSFTVDQLAKSLGLSDNAVRAHLAALERDGLVEQRTARRGGVGKPAYMYDMAPGAEPLFSRAYVPLLVQLLHVLADRMPPAELDEVLRTVGRRLAAEQRIPPGGTKERLEAAVAILNEMGGIAHVEERGGTTAIHGSSCPLSVAVHGHPQVCHAVETLLTELVGVPVRERCDRGDRAHCCFEVEARAAGRAAEVAGDRD